MRKTVLPLLSLALLCASRPMSIASEGAAGTYSVEVVVLRLEGAPLPGRAGCSREAWCHVKMADEYFATILHHSGEYTINLSGPPFGSMDECCTIEGSTGLHAKVEDGKRTFEAALYLGEWQDDLVYRRSRSFGRIYVVFAK